MISHGKIAACFRHHRTGHIDCRIRDKSDPTRPGFFATCALIEKHVPSMRQEGAAVEASVASAAAAWVALAMPSTSHRSDNLARGSSVPRQPLVPRTPWQAPHSARPVACSPQPLALLLVPAWSVYEPYLSRAGGRLFFVAHVPHALALLRACRERPRRRRAARGRQSASWFSGTSLAARG